MSDVFFFLIILAGVTVFAVEEAKKSMRKKSDSAGNPARAVPSTQNANAASPSPASPTPDAGAPRRSESLAAYTPGFMSMEGQAEETDWNQTVMAREGTDPCHDGMYAEPYSENHEKPVHPERHEEAREWAKAVVMAEILKRPAERRWNARGRS